MIRHVITKVIDTWDEESGEFAQVFVHAEDCPGCQAGTPLEEGG